MATFGEQNRLMREVGERSFGSKILTFAMSFVISCANIIDDPEQEQ